jgi:flagellar hook-associated protein 3 FlgL
MTVDRIATSAQSQYMLSQVLKSEKTLNTYEAQVSSGYVSTDYTGLGDKVAALESAKAAAARADAYSSNTQLAVTQTDLQNTQLSTLSSLAGQLKEAISTAAANGDGTGLMNTAQDIFQQASAILNSTDSNGNYIYAGGQGNTKPFTATSLSDLTTGTVSSFFQNGTQKTSVLVGDGQSVQIGVLASDVGTQLMTALQNLQNADSPSGSLGSTLTDTQVTTLTDNVMPSAMTAYTELNNSTATNGEIYSRLQDDITNQQSLSTLYQGFVSDIQDVDMTTAAANLSQAQTALQAALEVSTKLNNLSLLNYLPTTSSTG